MCSDFGLIEMVFNMKFTGKQLARLATKSGKQEAVEKRKSKQALEKGNMDGARIFAENAIRNKKQSLNYLRLQSRLDAVASKLEGHSKMMQVTGQMAGVTQNLQTALGTMDIEKITVTMDTFERQFEDLDLQAKYMDGAISDTTSLSTPQDQVDTLLHQIADEHGLEVGDKLNAPLVPSLGTKPIKTGHMGEDLESRFAALSNSGAGPSK